MLFCMVEVFFKVRQRIKIIIFIIIKVCPKAGYFGVVGYMDKYPWQWAPPTCFHLPPEQVQKPKKQAKYFLKVCWYLALQREPKSLQCVRDWPRFIEPYSTLSTLRRERRSLNLTMRQLQVLWLLQLQ